MAIDRSIDTLAARKAGQPKTTGSLTPLPKRCATKLKYTGTSDANPPRYCMNYPMKGKVRCWLCGGKSLMGFDLPQTKTAAGSKYAVLSPKVFEQFTASLADVALLDLRPDVALLDTLLWQAAAQIGTGASAAQWKDAIETFDELERSRTKESINAARVKLRAILRLGADQASAREEASRLAERRTKAVRTYQQLQVDAQDLIPAKQVGLVLAIFAALMREFIADDHRRHEFSQRFIAALGPRLRAPAGAVAAPDAVAGPGAIEPA